MHRFMSSILAVCLLIIAMIAVHWTFAASSGPVYLPLLSARFGPPDFVINSPTDGLSVGGTTIFAIQVTDPGTVSSVMFTAGDTNLGTDTTADDGFQTFLDASKLPEGSTTLSALATGPGGATTKTIDVTIVPQPPSSATIDANGGTLATATGSTITIPAGATDGNVDVSVTERTQAEVTAATGVDWDKLGVTFLGAVDVQTKATFSRPLGVSSVGYSNRIQPGQAVVTYKILPDQDGDGVGELVVVNGANVAPNGTIVSSSIMDISINTITIQQQTFTPSSLQKNSLSGPPGTPIIIRGNGFNTLSVQGNVAVFHSLVADETVEAPIKIDNDGNQILSTLVPIMSPGAATMTLRNHSTGSIAGPFNLVIQPSPPPSRPAIDIIDQVLASTIQGADLLLSLNSDAPASQVTQITQIKAKTASLRASFQDIAHAPSPAQKQVLDRIASMFEQANLTSSIAQLNSLQAASITLGLTQTYQLY